jgi:3-deoxy-D-manno-octulosonic acid kinase
MSKPSRASNVAEPEIKRVGHRSVLFDRALLDDAFSDWFEPRYWRERDRVRGVAAGRGSAMFVAAEQETWVLRHYHRGGIMARFVDDYYVWHGLNGSRAFREWRLLAELYERGMPVPRPIAARVCRYGLSYTADILTAYLEGTRSVNSMLHAGESLGDQWQAIGRTLRQFHDQGVDHSDLNVGNILVDDEGCVYLIDFDKGRLRESGSWKQGNLRRLQRSLRKTALETGIPYDEEVWRRVEAGYEGRAYTSA